MRYDQEINVSQDDLGSLYLGHAVLSEAPCVEGRLRCE